MNNILNLLQLAGVEESFQLPPKMMEILMDSQKRESFFHDILSTDPDLTTDFIRDGFQDSLADRDKLKQDYTPDSVCQITCGIAGKAQSFADICAGSGALTIAAWKDNPNAVFYCEEISDAVIPLLLTNLAIRNMKAIVNHGDSLKRTSKTIYQLIPGERFSSVLILDTLPEITVDRVISNPPYSLRWEGKMDGRFEDYGLAPNKAADYAFILHGMSLLKEQGRMVVVVPHGVLFRGNSEAAIRRKLIEKKEFAGVIGLPSNLFLNTSIPVCLVVLEKGRQENNIFFIEASKDFEKQSGQNRMNPEHIQKVLDCWKEKTSKEKFSALADFEQIAANDFNLNLPRYVDTFEAEPIGDLADICKELADLEAKITETTASLFEDLSQLCGFTFQEWEAINIWNKTFFHGRKRTSPKSQIWKERKKESLMIQDALW